MATANGESRRDALIAAEGLTKSFPGTVALDHVGFEVRPGEIHALLGANGAGKTTLMMILSGVLQPDSGRLMVGAREVRLQGPRHAQELGIGTVFQELSLVPSVPIAENLFLNRLPSSGFDLVNWSALRQQAEALLARMGVQLDAMTPVQSLPVAIRQLVEIAKALSLQPQVLLFDEPTSALSVRETDRLFSIMRDLKARGLGLVFITHRMGEVFLIADRVTVLRDGRKVGTFRVEELTPDRVVSLMVGHELRPEVVEHRRVSGTPLLTVTGLRTAGLDSVTFQLHRGEILGVTGLSGSGRNALGRALFGLLPWEDGQGELDGHALRLRTPAEAIAHGIGFLPPDRKEAGLFLRMSVRDNIIATRLQDASRFGLVRSALATRAADRFVDALSIRTRSLFQAVNELSGGNQQKVLVAKWLAVRPRVLIAEDPTMGIDVATRTEIHGLMRQIAADDAAILLITGDLPELVSVADRILVLANGRVAAERRGTLTSEEEILALASVTEVSPPGGRRELPGEERYGG